MCHDYSCPLVAQSMITEAIILSCLDRHKDLLESSGIVMNIVYEDSDQCFVVDFDAATFVAQAIVYTGGEVEGIVYTREQKNGITLQVDQRLPFSVKLDLFCDFVRQHA